MNRKAFFGRKLSDFIQLFIVIGLGILICLPVLMLFSGTFVDELEWTERLLPVLLNNDDYIQWKWIPDYPTLGHYKRLLFYSPQFLVLFWNSIKIVGCILLGQLLVGVPCAWAFAAYDFKGKNILFSIYVILMLLPFQVTMLSKYLVLNRMQLMNTHLAVILPAIFSTFPVFIMYRSFSSVPGELLEAARIDGAGEFKIFWKVGIPLAQGGILAAFVLGFLECWNMMEEPLAFLKDQSLWPLSLYLPEIGVEQAGYACTASMIVLIVSLFVFAMFQDSLEQGIVSSALKA